MDIPLEETERAKLAIENTRVVSVENWRSTPDLYTDWIDAMMMTGRGTHEEEYAKERKYQSDRASLAHYGFIVMTPLRSKKIVCIAPSCQILIPQYFANKTFKGLLGSRHLYLKTPLFLAELA